MYGKNNFVWETEPPPAGRRREQDIIRMQPGVTGLSTTDDIADVFQLFVTKEIVDNIVIQTNREAK